MEYFHEYFAAPKVLHRRAIAFAPHLHAEIEIIAMRNGNAAVTADGRTYPASRGDFILIFPNVVHSYSVGTDVDAGKFIFSPALIPEMADAFRGRRPISPVIRSADLAGTHLTALADEIIDEFNTASEAVRKAYLLLLTGKLLARCDLEPYKGAMDPIVFRILEYCKVHYREDLTLDRVAQALYVSKSYVSHIFCGKLKINFRSYLNLLRINEAAALLRSSTISATQAATQSGFGSIRTFNRAFLKVMGKTPKAYRDEVYRASAESRGR